MNIYITIFLCIAVFTTGFIASIIGGGGLIQTPVGSGFITKLTYINRYWDFKKSEFSICHPSLGVLKNRLDNQQEF